MLAASTLLGIVPGALLVPSTSYASTQALTFTGYGVGSGNGASQFGEAGYASQGHLTYQQILAHFYGGTTLSTIGDRLITVWLTAGTGQPVTVYDPQGLVVNNITVPSNTPIRVTDTGGAITVDQGVGAVGCSAPAAWSPLTTVTNALNISPQNPPSLGQMVNETSSQALAWCKPGGSVESVRGYLGVTTNQQGQQVLTNQLGLESYVRGVIGNEMPAVWGTLGSAGPQGQAWGFQALEAQAVEARTYALAVGNSYGFAQICDSDYCQVYGGFNTGQSSQEQALIDAAQVDTLGQILEQSSGAPAFTQYSASDGGYTAGGDFPAVPDPYDAGCYASICNPWDPWTQTVSVSVLQQAFNQVGTVQGINVLQRSGNGTDGGRILSIQVVGSAGSSTVPGAEFASMLGLNSDWFSVSGPLSINNDGGATPPASPGQSATSGIIVASSDGGTAAEDGATDLGSTYTYGITGLSGTRPLNAPVVGVASTPDGKGYWLVAADGGVFDFGDAHFYGSTYTYGITGLSGTRPLNAPIVGIASTPDGKGYWLVAADGGVFDFGDATYQGSAYSKGFTGLTGSHPLAAPVVGIASTPGANGYWLLESNGTVLSFGAAQSFGQLTGASKIVGIAATADGQGYWLLGANGAVYGFGDASSYGSLNLQGQGTTAVSIVTAPNGQGYSIILSNGQVVGFNGGPSAPALGPTTTGHGAPIIAAAVLGDPPAGAEPIINQGQSATSGIIVASSDGGTAAEDGATDLGSTYTYGITGLSGTRPLNAPVVGVASTPDGKGYWLVAADGGVFDFGDAHFYGSTYTYGITGLSGTRPLNAPIVGIASTPDGKGYWLVAADGGVFDFGDATYQGSAYSKGFTGLTGSHPLAAPVVGIASTPGANGYWLLESNGTVLSFGAAQYYGDIKASTTGSKFVGIVASPTGRGYTLLAADGATYGFGDSPSAGSVKAHPGAVAIIQGPNGQGYSIILSNGQVVGFNGGPSAPALGPTTTGHGAPVIGGTAVN
jgi:SpoIID/LytB domain protein